MRPFNFDFILCNLLLAYATQFGVHSVYLTGRNACVRHRCSKNDRENVYIVAEIAAKSKTVTPVECRRLFQVISSCSSAIHACSIKLVNYWIQMLRRSTVVTLWFMNLEVTYNTSFDYVEGDISQARKQKTVSWWLSQKVKSQIVHFDHFSWNSKTVRIVLQNICN